MALARAWVFAVHLSFVFGRSTFGDGRRGPWVAAALVAALGATGCLATFGGTARPSDEPRPAAPAQPEAPAVSVVAVFDVEDGTEGLTPKETRQLGDYLAAQVASIPGTRVVPRDQLRSAIVDAKADSYKACFDQSCQIELGKAVSASKTVATKLLRVGTRCAMTTAVYDLKTETTERAASTRTDCTADALFNAVDALVRELGGPAPKRTAVAERDAPVSEPRRTQPSRSATREEPPIELVLDESATRDRSAQESDPYKASAAERRAVNAARVPASVTNASAVVPDPVEPTASTKIARTTELEPTKPALAPVEVRWISRGGQRILRLPRTVAFQEQGDTLDPGARRVLEQVALAIVRDPALRGVKLEVVGHAEAQERGKAELSERRARTVRAFLVDHGAPLAHLALVAASDRDPLTAGVRPNERALNRRVELRIALEE